MPIPVILNRLSIGSYALNDVVEKIEEMDLKGRVTHNIINED
jgi:hypothetical protein